MHAYRIHEFGGPETLKRDDLPAPAPGPGEVLIKVKAVSLNYRDLLISKGHYNPKLPLPRIPLSDGAGEVTATGPGATRFKPGDRVAACFMPAWTAGPIDDSKARSAMGGEIDGTLAEEIVMPEEGVVSIPEHLSFEEAATLPCAAVTAWHALVDSGGIKPGDTVLTLGTGGVSIFALQFAKMAGARVISTSSHDEKVARLREMGASVVINYKTTPEWDRQVLALTQGRGVDHVVEVGGAGTLPRSFRAVRRGGHIALIGVLSGLGDVNPMPILMKGIRVQGIFVGSRTMFEAMNRAITVSQLHPVIDRVFDFQDAIGAFKHLESGSHFGKVVVRV
ncbi:MAG: zinc-dependent alcohol dehydrogenase family protein [Isosphaeraceae bacterium]